MKSKIYTIALILGSVLFVASCKHEPMAVLDETLFNESTAPDLISYRNGDLLPATSPSPHGDFVLKYNSIAAQVLDSNGNVPDSASFPNGSLIVKEIMEDGKLTLYAIMKKDSLASFAGENWLWAEYKPKGEVYYSVSRKGTGCIGCHSQEPQSDFTRVFDLH